MQAKFIQSASRHEQLPHIAPIEVAFAGRSNVGKSTLLGCLLGHRKLVRTSRTPGRTLLLNLFSLGPELEPILACIDLPGYGYAKVSKGQRLEIRRMMRSYIRARVGLSGVVLVLDARREEVTDDDRDLANEVLEADRPLLVAVTKLDLIPKTKQGAQLRKIEHSLGIPPGSSVRVSGKTGEGLKELMSRLLELGEPISEDDVD